MRGAPGSLVSPVSTDSERDSLVGEGASTTTSAGRADGERWVLAVDNMSLTHIGKTTTAQQSELGTSPLWENEVPQHPHLLNLVSQLVKKF